MCARRRFWWTLFWSLFTSVPHRKNLEQGYTNFIYKTFAFRIPWKKPQLLTGRIYPPNTEILFPTTNIKFLRLVVLAVGNKTSWLQKSSKYINRLEGLVSFSCVRNLIYKNTWDSGQTFYLFMSKHFQDKKPQLPEFLREISCSITMQIMLFLSFFPSNNF